jgi:hypothetical protein
MGQTSKQACFMIIQNSERGQSAKGPAGDDGDFVAVQLPAGISKSHVTTA